MATQAFSGDHYARGERVRITTVVGVPDDMTLGTVQVIGDNGWYVVRMDTGEGRSVHHSAIDTFGIACVACGEEFKQEPTDKAEVVNKTTGARGVAHAECYLADTCCYDLA